MAGNQPAYLRQEGLDAPGVRSQGYRDTLDFLSHVLWDATSSSGTGPVDWLPPEGSSQLSGSPLGRKGDSFHSVPPPNFPGEASAG